MNEWKSNPFMKTNTAVFHFNTVLLKSLLKFVCVNYLFYFALKVYNHQPKQINVQFTNSPDNFRRWGRVPQHLLPSAPCIRAPYLRQRDRTLRSAGWAGEMTRGQCIPGPWQPDTDDVPSVRDTAWPCAVFLATFLFHRQREKRFSFTYIKSYLQQTSEARDVRLERFYYRISEVLFFFNCKNSENRKN